MPTLIKGGRVVSDDWTLREEITDGSITPHTIVPASFALAHADEVFGSADEVGIWLPGDSDQAYIMSLMQGVYQPGKMAAWIAPPDRGINNNPVDYEYVKLR